MTLTLSPDRAEQEVIGQTLRTLRERRGVFQKDVGRGLGVSTQAWNKYEAGERKFTAERIDEVLAILGATREDYDFERARILGVDSAKVVPERRQDFVFDVYGRARAGPQGAEVYDISEPMRQVDLRQILGPRTRAMEIGGDSVSPWGESGEIVLYDLDRYPRRGSGCVIETKAGEAYVKLYEKSDGSTLFVRELFPEARTVTFALEDIKGVYAVRLRGD
jgi:phage repressor protein C with HTH and peptisase S24 domain